MPEISDKKFQTKAGMNRQFSESFKRQKVKELENKVISVKDLCKLYEVSRTSVYNWIYLYSQAERGVKTVVQMESEAQKTLLLQQRVAALERIIGQKQLEIDVLSKCISIASETLGFDIKKKYEPTCWNGTEKTSQNTPIV